MQGAASGSPKEGRRKVALMAMCRGDKGAPVKGLVEEEILGLGFFKIGINLAQIKLK